MAMHAADARKVRHFTAWMLLCGAMWAAPVIGAVAAAQWAIGGVS